MASLDEGVDKSTSSLTGLDEVGSGTSSSGHNYTSRQYRDSSGSKTSGSGSQITEGVGGTSARHGSNYNTHSEECAMNPSIILDDTTFLWNLRTPKCTVFG